jgi:leader peptidase (prepilin peptidase)/N-methyltransferase
MGTYWLIRRRQGMGWGDPKMLAMIGAFTGALPALPIVLLVSTVAGSIVGVAVIVLGRRKGAGAFTALPFGPFLALGAIVYLLHGKSLGRSWFVDPALIFGF